MHKSEKANEDSLTFGCSHFGTALVKQESRLQPP